MWSNKKNNKNNSSKFKSRSGGKSSRFGQTLGADRRSRSQWNQAVSSFHRLFLGEIEK